MHLIWSPAVNQSKGKLESPYLFNLIRDPKEESDVATANRWVLQPMERMRTDLERSLFNFPAPEDPQRKKFMEMHGHNY